MGERKFSVSMCVYGKDDPAWFRTAVESILNQTAPPEEVVLVVDGPVPEALDKVIAGYEQRSNFKVLRLPENVGHGNARRVSFENCTCELIALMDADDISAPDRFEKQLALFARDDSLSAVGSHITEFLGEPEQIVAARRVPCSDGEIKKYMRTRCPMNQGSVMFKKADVERAGGYLDWFCEEDYYLWLRMYLAGMKFANIPENLVNFRVGRELYARRGGWKYFCSEAKLQGFMLKNKIIGLPTYTVNVAKRLIVQVLLPNKIRGWVFRKFAREKV